MSKYITPLSFYISKEAIPGDLGVFENGINSLFAKLFIQNLIVSRNRVGEDIFYSFDLVSKERLALGIPGTDGLALVLNPGFNAGDTSEFPMQFRYSWKLLRVIENFRLDTFNFSPGGYFDIILDILDISEEEVLGDLMRLNTSDDETSDPFDNFVSSFNSNTNPTPSPLLTSPSSTLTFNDKVDDLVNQIRAGGYSVSTAILSADINTTGNFDDFISNAQLLFKKHLGQFGSDDFKNFLLPDFSLSLESLNLALEFPTSVFQPVDSNISKAKLTFDVGSLHFDKNSGFDFNSLSAFSFTKSEILKTGFTLEIIDLKLDLSRKNNIPEAIADGRPNDFVGAYITEGTIGFPEKWSKQSGGNAELKVRNFLVGTGGISGDIILEKNSGVPGHVAPLIPIKFGELEFNLNVFSISFQQNAIIGSDISGTLKIPRLKDAQGNDAELNVKVVFDKKGDFSISFSEEQGIPFEIPNVLELTIQSLTIGEKNDKFFVKVSGSIEIIALPASLEIMDGPIPIPGLVIWEDGSIELEGGRVVLPRAFTLKLSKAVTISITAIDFGSIEKKHGGQLRKYSYIGFSGGLDMSPGGVDVQGNGVRFFYTTDHGGSKPFHSYLELDEIKIDIYLPKHKEPEDAEIAINGFLSIANPEDNSADPNSSSGNPSQEYMGSVKFLIRKKKFEIGGGASMRLAPKVPAFVVDAFLEISKPILVGNTGLGIYGFRGLIGHRYKPSMAAAGLPADSQDWWQYYKTPPTGIDIQKFGIEEKAFSIGAGIAFGTYADNGYTFSSKLMFVLTVGTPGEFLLSGMAGILQNRVSFADAKDPPFRALLVINSKTAQTNFGLDYKLPDNDKAVLEYHALLETAYFFDNPSAWYLNMGRDLPVEKRISARILDIFNGFAYIMVSSKGIKAGGGSTYTKKKNFGPVKAKLKSYLEAMGFVSFRPLQLGGSIAVYAGIDVRVFGIGMNFGLGAGLAAEGPRPYIIAGYVYLEFKVPVPFKKKKFRILFDFTWKFNKDIDKDPIPPIRLKANSTDPVPVNAVHILSNDTFPVSYSTIANDSNIPPPGNSLWALDFEDSVVPLDSFIDVQFKRPIRPTTAVSNIGGFVTIPKSFMEVVPPRRGVSNQVRHEYKVLGVHIKIWDPGASDWRDYKVYDAVTAIKSIPEVDQTMVDSMKDGYWQKNKAGQYDKLRLLATNMFSYTTEGSPGKYQVDRFGFDGGNIFCATTETLEHCLDWLSDPIDTTYDLNKVKIIEKLKFRFKDQGLGGKVISHSAHGMAQGLHFQGKTSLELLFTEATSKVSLKLDATAKNITIEYYAFKEVNQISQFVLIRTDNETDASLANIVLYEDNNEPIDKVIITYDGGAGFVVPDTSPLRFGTRTYGGLSGWFPGVISDVMVGDAIFPETEINDYITQGDEPNNVISRWKLDSTTTGADDEKNLNDGTANGGISIASLGGRSGYNFDGVDDYVEVTHDNSIGLLGDDFSMMAWVNISGAAGIQTIIDKRGTSGYHLYLSDGRVGYQIMRNKAYANRISKVNVADGKWHHIAVTHNATTGDTIIYVDGVEEGSFLEKKVSGGTGDLYLMECCYQTQEEYITNLSLPSASVVDEEIQAMADAMTKAYQPVWRPYSDFAVQVHAQDTVDGLPKNYYFNFGFRTKGPIGHFPIDHPKFDNLPTAGKDKQLSVNSLKHYIDYKHSYPNADGKLVGAKPLYWKAPRLQLFFNRAYVHSMFENWEPYQGNTEIFSKIEATIFKPESQNLGEGFILGTSLEKVDFSYKRQDEQIIDNIRINGDLKGIPCLAILDGFDSSTYVGRFVADDLEPSKLYTAIFQSVVDEDGTGSTEELGVPVHQYGFVTSQYPDLKTHVESHIIGSEQGQDIKAIFPLTFAPHDVIKAKKILTNTLESDDGLYADFADPFDRLINGAFRLKAMESPLTTECNILVSSNGGTILGLLVRSPEPFYDPKMPLDLATAPVEIQNILDSTGQADPANYVLLYSKDRASIFISTDQLSMLEGTINLDFNEYFYDSSSYEVKDPNEKGIINFSMSQYV